MAGTMAGTMAGWMRWMLVIVMAGCTLLAAGAAYASPAEDKAGAKADGHDTHDKASVIPTIVQGVAPAIAALLVFGVVFGVLYTQVWPKIVKGLSDREEKIRNEIESAEMAQQQAKRALEQYERSLADARAEAQRMLDQTRLQQQQLAAELRAKADEELTAMRDRARRDIEQAKRAALNEIYAEAGNVATAIAGKILKREISSADQSRLVSESLAELQTLNRNN